VDLRREFTAVMAEAEASESGGGGGGGGALGSMEDGGAGAGSGDEARGLQSVLPLLSLTTTALSFTTLTRVLFRIAFRYRCAACRFFKRIVGGACQCNLGGRGSIGCLPN
jgi:hypothetical protein